MIVLCAYNVNNALKNHTALFFQECNASEEQNIL